MKRELFDDEHEHELFRTSVRRWLDKEVVPHHDQWDEAGIVPRSMFADAGRHGFLGMAIPEHFGGGGVDDFRYNLVLNEEVQATGVGATHQSRGSMKRWMVPPQVRPTAKASSSL
jgi:alkylation response protein AidB-like acyl-CoA dehydrogenase